MHSHIFPDGVWGSRNPFEFIKEFLSCRGPTEQTLTGSDGGHLITDGWDSCTAAMSWFPLVSLLLPLHFTLSEGTFRVKIVSRRGQTLSKLTLTSDYFQKGFLFIINHTPCIADYTASKGMKCFWSPAQISKMLSVERSHCVLVCQLCFLLFLKELFGLKLVQVFYFHFGSCFSWSSAVQKQILTRWLFLH